MEHIMVPIDFSSASLAGIKRAIDLATKTHAQIHLVNIVAPLKISADVSKEHVLQHSLNVLIENESKLTTLLEQLDHKGINIHSEIKVDEFEKAIKKFIHKQPIDLLIVGVNGVHTIGDLFCNEKVKETCSIKCPIEIVKAPENQ